VVFFFAFRFPTSQLAYASALYLPGYPFYFAGFGGKSL